MYLNSLFLIGLVGAMTPQKLCMPEASPFPTLYLGYFYEKFKSVYSFTSETDEKLKELV
jgi:hypothetical protein